MADVNMVVNLSGNDYYWTGWKDENLLLIHRYIKLSELHGADIIWADDFQCVAFYEDDTNSGTVNLEGLYLNVTTQKRIDQISLTCTFNDSQANGNRAILLIGTSNSLSVTQDINTLANWVNNGLMKVYEPKSGSTDMISSSKAIFDLIQNAATVGKDFRFLYFACYCVKNNATLSTNANYSKV